MISVHFNSTYAKKRGVAKDISGAVRTAVHEQDVDKVTGDFNSVAWRGKPGSDQHDSTIEGDLNEC